LLGPVEVAPAACVPTPAVELSACLPPITAAATSVIAAAVSAAIISDSGRAKNLLLTAGTSVAKVTTLSDNGSV
jgi:hypothetical protein